MRYINLHFAYLLTYLSVIMDRLWCSLHMAAGDAKHLT